MAAGPAGTSLPVYVVRDRDRYGRIRLYFQRHAWADGRRVTGRKTRLPDDVASLEFQRAYLAAREASEANAGSGAAADVQRGTLARPVPGSLRDLVARYKRTGAWLDLDQRTRYVRALQLDAMMGEPIKPGSALLMADCPVSRLSRAHVEMLRDRKAATPHEANNRTKALRGVIRWALAANEPGMLADPSAGVAPLRAASEGFHSWTLAEVAQFEAHWPVGSMARLALALLLYTGLRRSDVVRLGRPHATEITVRGQDGDATRVPGLRLTLHKGRQRRHTVLEVPLLAELADVIARTKTGDLTYLVTAYGRPFTSNGFGNRMRAWCTAAGLTNCSAHGLRKAGATIAADNGATTHQLMAIFGWASVKQAEVYTRAADRRRLAAGGMRLMLRNE